MAFLLVGLLFLAMKVGEFGPGSDWAWWIVLAPFGLAVAWWSFSDSMGLTQARAMRKMDEKQAARRQKTADALGLGAGKRKR